MVSNGPSFGLRDSKFVFDNLKPEIPFLPRYEPGTFIYDGSNWPLTRVLPIQVDRAQFTFNTSSNLSIMELMAPTNVTITISANISLPAGNDPVIGGGVKDLTITFAPDGTPRLSLDAVSLDIAPGKFKIPPINDLGGKLYIGGISDPIGHPERIFFAGKLTGSYQEMKLGFLAAIKLTGPIGLCLEVKGGSVGIPLPFGFLINGASGGISFMNNNGDPCHIKLPPAASPAEGLFNTLLDGIASGFETLLGTALPQTPMVADALYEEIQRRLYEGLPCFDMAFQESPRSSRISSQPWALISLAIFFARLRTRNISK